MQVSRVAGQAEILGFPPEWGPEKKKAPEPWRLGCLVGRIAAEAAPTAGPVRGG
jgi:hypothetical protein